METEELGATQQQRPPPSRTVHPAPHTKPMTFFGSSFLGKDGTDCGYPSQGGLGTGRGNSNSKMTLCFIDSKTPSIKDAQLFYKPLRKNKYPGSPSLTRNPHKKPGPKALTLRVKGKENKPTMKKRKAINMRISTTLLGAGRGNSPQRTCPSKKPSWYLYSDRGVTSNLDPAPKNTRYVLHAISLSSQALLKLICGSLVGSKPPV